MARSAETKTGAKLYASKPSEFGLSAVNDYDGSRYARVRIGVATEYRSWIGVGGGGPSIECTAPTGYSTVGNVYCVGRDPLDSNIKAFAYVYVR